MQHEADKQGRRAMTVGDRFSIAAQWTSLQCGRASTFVAACVIIIVWAVTGPVFGFSDTWQLIINTGTTIVTFLMVFLIQNTQNRDMAVLQLKLDELIRVSHNARNRLLDLEDMSEADLKRLKASFARLAADGADATLLQEAADDLEQAEDDIEEAREKVASFASAAEQHSTARSPQAASPKV